MKNLRRTYPREEYLKKRGELHQLVQAAKQVHLDPKEHNITGETAAPIIYLDGQAGPRFDQLNRNQFDCREIKIINPTQPALSLHFTTRHKYQIERKPTVLRVRAYLETLLENLRDYLDEHPEDPPTLEQIVYLEKVHRNPDAYELAISNYFRFYQYPYVNYRYADGKGYSTGNTHLIASYLEEVDEQENYDQFPRYNVIFIDVEAINRPRPANDHASAETYLNGFENRYDLGRRDLFINAKKSPKRKFT